MKEHTIRFLQRRVQYHDFLALEGVDLEIKRGEIVGIIGRNGAGKSTLLKVIARVLRPSSGHVWIRGRVAPLLEFGAGFHPELTGRENVFLNGTILGFSRAEMEAKFPRIVDFAELADFIDAPLRTYSSGMVARLGFAVATDVDPDVLLVDEVLSVGDSRFQKKSAERIESFRAAGATILLVSHSLETVKSLCTRAIWLSRGRVMGTGSPMAVVQQYMENERSADSGWRFGTRRVEVEQVRLMNAKGEPQSVFKTGDTLVLEFDYCAHEAISSPVFGMALHRDDGIHVSGPNTSFAGVVLPTVQGHGTVTFTVPYLPLLEGAYRVSISAHNQGDTEFYDYHDRAYYFEVRNQEGGVQERFGLITLRGEWKHTSGSRGGVGS
ncbi:MAG: ABC transporter ATP-binding protein [Chloroflexi bacterium]|nr:ABC transporter ATP-binding protein [Chloroflexota bacterium]